MFNADNSKKPKIHSLPKTTKALSILSSSLMLMTFVIVQSLFSFNPITASAGSGPKLVISFFNQVATMIDVNTTSEIALSACVDGQGVTPIEPYSTKSISVAGAGDDGVYDVSVYSLLYSPADGSLIDPCTLGTTNLFWSGTVAEPLDSTKIMGISLGGSESVPNVTQEEVDNDAVLSSIPGSGITSEWSNWEVNGQGLTPITMQEFNGTLYQAVRGTDNNIYTRSSFDGQLWSEWTPNGQTFNEISMETFFGRLYQAVRGTDGLIYTRNTDDGTVWSNWISNGATPGTVSMTRNGSVLVQAVRGTDNNIYTRSLPANGVWSNWVADGQTFNNVEMTSLNNAVYQSVVGTDKLVYLRHNTTPFNPGSWSSWVSVKDSSNAAISTASTSVELTVSNNNLMVATTNAQSRPVLARLLNPLVNTLSSTATDVNSLAKFNSLTTIDEYFPGFDVFPGYANNTAIQTIVNPANGNISYRTASGSNMEASLWSPWTVNGATTYQPTNFVYYGQVIQAVVGTDGNIYTRRYIISQSIYTS